MEHFPRVGYCSGCEGAKKLWLARLLKGPLGSQRTAGQIFEEYTREDGKEETPVPVARKQLGEKHPLTVVWQSVKGNIPLR